MQFSVNHLSPFRLTLRLLPVLAANEGARVVSMSSRAHRLSPVDFDDPFFERRPYDPWKAYGQSKTQTAMGAVAPPRRASSRGVQAFSVHPGAILTDLARHLSKGQISSFGALDEDGNVRIDPARDLKTVEQGAATAIWCASSAALADIGGVYCEDCDVAPVRSGEDEHTDGVRDWAVDPDLAKDLWRLSEESEDLAFADPA
jgi:NAD(P)-dependent dehydrogenase (short-subunit alcohol dehydrogenase family)